MRILSNKYLKAVKILFANKELKEAALLLHRLWNSPETTEENEFEIFCAYVELQLHFESQQALDFMEEHLFEESCGFLSRRTLFEQSVLFDWHGQLNLYLGNYDKAFESLKRSASLGRDTDLLWWHLGNFYLENRKVEFGIRCLRRSLEFFCQLNFGTMKTFEYPIGFFLGRHPFSFGCDKKKFFDVLLPLSGLVQSRNERKQLLNLVETLVHNFPDDDQLYKVKILIENQFKEIKELRAAHV